MRNHQNWMDRRKRCTQWRDYGRKVIRFSRKIYVKLNSFGISKKRGWVKLMRRPVKESLYTNSITLGSETNGFLKQKFSIGNSTEWCFIKKHWEFTVKNIQNLPLSTRRSRWPWHLNPWQPLFCTSVGQSKSAQK